MQNRAWDRERSRRETENDDDWDWYYYEYRYVPYAYSPYRIGNEDWNQERGQRSNYGRRNIGRDYNYDYGTEQRNPNYGPYSGVGPRGYRRSDERITDDVNDRLTWYGQLDATDIDAQVSEGVVTLSGTVEDRRQKRMAEDLAESVPGVEDVNNQLKIRNRNSNWNQGEGQMSNQGGMNRQQIRPGMEVIGRDGGVVGEVKEVRSNNFLVDRSMARDVYIPFNACQMGSGQIRLNVRADEVDNQGWEMPDLLETEDTQKSSKKR